MCLCEEQQDHQPKDLTCQRGQHLPSLGPSLHTSRVRSWPLAAGVGLVWHSSCLGCWVLCTCAEHSADLSGWQALCFNFVSLSTHQSVDLVTVFILGGFFVPLSTSSRTVLRQPALAIAMFCSQGKPPFPTLYALSAACFPFSPFLSA